MSGERTAIKSQSWDDMMRGLDLEGETKNFKVPPELIELARAASGKGSVGTLTPLAPKPSDEVVVVVPPIPPLASLEASPPFAPEQAVYALGSGSDAELDDSQPCASEPLPLISAAQRAARREAEAAPASQASPTRAFVPYFTGAAIVGAYVGLCYLANALIAALP